MVGDGGHCTGDFGQEGSPLRPSFGTPTTTTYPLTVLHNLTTLEADILGGYMQSGCTHISIPLSFVSLHIPDLQLDHWRDRGIHLLEDLYDGTSIRSFTALQEKYGLPLTDHFQYQWIAHLLKPLLTKQWAIPSRVMALLTARQHSLTKGLRTYYNLLTHNETFYKTSNIDKWEIDLGKQFSLRQWYKAIRWAHNSSSCANHMEQYHKLLTRWYFTPLRLAKSFPTASPYCWRSCGSLGSILHVFWSCPRPLLG